MCGITGIFHFDRTKKINLDLLKKMNDVISHRGPDGEGFYVDGNIGLAHRRLKIIDLETGDQPMYSFDKNIVIVFNGEIYNYIELRNELISYGHRFQTRSDTEVIIKSYLQWGFDCQNKFNGMWSFALWDKKKEQLFLSRDRIGEKPLFYSEFNNSFFFGSEMKSILSCNISKSINNDLTEVYLTLSYIPGKQTFYKNINKLLPGHFLIVTKNSVIEKKYWDLPQIDEENMNKDKNKINEEFTYLLEDSVKIRMRSDVSFGAFLSGGLDSASIVSLMSKNSTLPIETFTIGFNDKKYNESELANLVAKKFSTNHNLGYVDEKSMQFFLDKVIYHFDEPFGDNSTIPTFQVSEYASKKVKMVLTGDGGDEVMSGYPTYLGLKYYNIYSKFPNVIKKNIPHLLNYSSNFFLNEKRFKIQSYSEVFSTANMKFVDRFCAKRPVTNLTNIKNITKNISGVIKIEDYMNDYVKHIPYRDDFYKNMYIDLKSRLPDGYLPKVDRMSMANSIETRAPFLDYRLIEFMTNIHKDVKVQGFQTKSILKNTIAKNLPNELLKSKKMGFVAPLTNWFKDDLYKEKLDQLSSFEWSLDNNVIRNVINDNLNGKSDNGLFIWQLLVLKAFHEN